MLIIVIFLIIFALILYGHRKSLENLIERVENLEEELEQSKNKVFSNLED